MRLKSIPLFLSFCVNFGAILTIASAQSEYNPPAGYYADADGLLGTALRNEVHNIIDNNKDLGYDAARSALRVLDEDPETEGNILLIYSGISVPGFRFNSDWNREHVWPQSFGADSDTIPGADLHHLYPANPSVNSSRSNKIFDWTDPNNRSTNANAPGSSFDSNSWEPRDEDKGRIARAMLYMDVRYDGSDSPDFNLAEAANQSASRFAKLSVLLEWHRLFPPDERERRRNHLIHTGFEFAVFTFDQGNRNPFVDIPDLAEAIFTGDEYIGWGTWRWQHFTTSQLINEDGISDLEDPDGDFRVNLVEYGVNTDPNTSNTEEIFNVTSFGGLGTQIRFTQQKSQQLAGIAYQIEVSSTPLFEETWAVLTEEDFSSAFTTDQGSVQLATYNLPASSEAQWFRLRVTRETGPDTALSAVYDPVLDKNPQIADSIFVYLNKLPDSEYKQSPWMGFVIDDQYPWTYHNEHGWIFIDAERDDDVWFLDNSLGWFFTSSVFYPYLYSSSLSQWIYYLSGTSTPNRWFITLEGDWIQEGSFLIP
jgi:endonuclease I